MLLCLMDKVPVFSDGLEVEAEARAIIRQLSATALGDRLRDMVADREVQPDTTRDWAAALT